LYLTTSKPLQNRLSGSDLEVRIANSRIGLQGWLREAGQVGADFHQVAVVCGTEISLLRGLRGLSPAQRVVVDGLIGRWSGLRERCVGRASASPEPTTSQPAWSFGWPGYGMVPGE